MDADKVAQLERILPAQDVAGQNGIVSHLAKIVFACGKVVREIMAPDTSVWDCAARLAEVMDTTTWPAEMIVAQRMQSWWSESLAIQRMMIATWMRVEIPTAPVAAAVTVLQLEAPRTPSETAGAGPDDPLTVPVLADDAATSPAPDSAQDPGPTTVDGGVPPNGPGDAAPVLHAVPLPHGGPSVGHALVGTTSALAATNDGGTGDESAQVGTHGAAAAVPRPPPPPPPPPAALPHRLHVPARGVAQPRGHVHRVCRLGWGPPMVCPRRPTRT